MPFDLIAQAFDGGVYGRDLRFEPGDLRFESTDTSDAVAFTSALFLAGAVDTQGTRLGGGAQTLGIALGLLVVAFGDQTLGAKLLYAT